MRKLIILLVCASVFCSLSSKSKSVTNGKLTETDQRRFDYLFYEGIKLKDNQKLDDALQAFRMCLTIDSLNAGALAETSTLYQLMGLAEPAMLYMKRAVNNDPKNWWYNVRLISMYSEQKNWKAAINNTLQLQTYYPQREEVYSVLANLYKENGEYQNSVDTYDKLESMAGIDQSISLEKFQLYYLLHKPQKGNDEIEKLIAKYPNDSRYKVLRGDIFMQQQMPDKAFESYQQVLQEDPQNARVYLSLSEYYNSKNDTRNALGSIVNALKSEQLDADTKVQILGQYVEKLTKDSASFSETEGLFKLLTERYPLEEQVHGYYAYFLQFQKRYDDALSEFETMVNINPKNEQTWLSIIQLYFSRKEFKQIIATCNRASLSLPTSSSFYFYKGISHFQLNETEQSLKNFQNGLQFIAPEQATLKSDFYAQIGDCYFKTENKDSAFIYYEKALLANPRNIVVLNNYAYYLSLSKKDLTKAERMSSKTVEIEPNNSTYLDTYAWILYEEGSYTLAKFYIERAIDNLNNDEDHGVIQEHYGDILYMNNEPDKAMEMWKKSMDAGNNSSDLKKKIENKGWDKSIKKK